MNRAQQPHADAQPRGEIPGSHAAGGAERVILREKYRQRAETHEHDAGPEIFLTFDFQLTILLISDTDPGRSHTSGPVCRTPSSHCLLPAADSFLTPV